MKVSAIVEPDEHKAIVKIAAKRSATIGAVVLLAIRRFIEDWRENPAVAQSLKIDKRRREARNK